MKKKMVSIFLIFCLISNTFIVSNVLADNTQISGDDGRITYDFKAGVDSTIDQDGWEIEESNSSGGYRNQPYGIQVQSNGIGEYFKVAFHVPVDGFYTIKFIGAGAGGGAIADIMVDDYSVGQIDFYSKDYTPAQPQLSLKTLELSKGIHYFTLKAVGKSNSWGYNMYPSEVSV